MPRAKGLTVGVSNPTGEAIAFPAFRLCLPNRQSDQVDRWRQNAIDWHVRHLPCVAAL
jgi:hypothetical protein